jgi:hypothetical protein
MPRHTKKSAVKKTPTRTFSYLTKDGKKEGRYKGKTPVSVAKKIGSRMLRSSSNRTVEVHVKEITMNSKKKEYKYKISRVKKPKTVIRDGKEITINYVIVAKAL